MSFRSDRRRDQASGRCAPLPVFCRWHSAGQIGENTRVSYDLAVWEGERPADDAAAGSEFEWIYPHYAAGQATGCLGMG
jgi:hypothetical protein